jgi:hypothetical protein
MVMPQVKAIRQKKHAKNAWWLGRQKIFSPFGVCGRIIPATCTQLCAAAP